MWGRAQTCLCAGGKNVKPSWVTENNDITHHFAGEQVSESITNSWAEDSTCWKAAVSHDRSGWMFKSCVLHACHSSLYSWQSVWCRCLYESSHSRACSVSMETTDCPSLSTRTPHWTVLMMLQWHFRSDSCFFILTASAWNQPIRFLISENGVLC